MPLFTSDLELSDDYPTIEPSLKLDFANSRALDPRITFTRDASGTYVNKDGLIKIALENEPRFDHDPITGESLGLLIEESRTNYQSGNTTSFGVMDIDITQGVSTASDVTTAPNGLQQAGRITASGVDEIQRIGYNTQTTASGQYNIFSVFVKKDSGTPILGFYSNTFVASNVAFNVDLSDGTTNTINAPADFVGKVEPFQNGWYRVSVMGTGSGNGGSWNINIVSSLTSARGAQSGSNNASASYFIWGVQEELSTFPFASSVIPIQKAGSYTRGADLPYIEGTSFSGWYNPEGGAYVLDVMADSDSGQFFGFGTSSYLESFNVSNSASTQFYISGNYNTSNAYTGNMNLNQSNKIGVSFNSTGQRVCSNGQSVNGSSFSSGASSLFTDFDRASFGGNIPWDKNYTNQKRTHVKSFSYYPKYLSDAQLQTLTQ